MKPKKNYDKLKVTKEVDSYEAWDSDVARGSLHALLIRRTTQTKSVLLWVGRTRTAHTITG